MNEPNLKRKDNIDNQKKYLIIAIVMVVTLFISSSYALLTNFDSTDEVVNISTGNLSVSINNTVDLIDNELNGKFPENDVDGYTNAKPITITITNNGSLNIEKYDVKLVRDEREGKVSTLSYDYIKYAIGTNAGVNLGSSNNVIYTGYELGVGESKTITLRLWIDEVAGNNALGKTFYGSLDVELHQKDGTLAESLPLNASYVGNYKTNFPTFDTQDSYLNDYGKKTVYYYYGANAKDNGNVLFAGYCWQIVRTTDNGGVKLLYNGVAENNQCSDDRTGKKGINSTAGVTDITGLGTTSVYGTGFTYDENGFTLTGVMTGKAWATDYENLIGTYTCKGTNTTCETISYIGRYVNTTTGYGSTYQIGDLLDKYTIGKSPFSPNYTTAAGVGYMYNKIYFSNDGTKTGDYGRSATWNGTSYDLSDTNNQTSATAQRRYVCDTDCTKVRYYYYADDSNTTYRYVLLEKGKSVNNLLYEMLNYKIQDDINNNKADATLNVYSSAIKRYLESWYNQNLKDYESLIDKNTVYCNDRSIINLGSWNSASSGTTAYLYFKHGAVNTGDLRCGNSLDRFSTENTRAKIDASIGLLTEPERHLMGEVYAGDGASYYWSLSPYVVVYDGVRIRMVSPSGAYEFNYVHGTGCVRPVITLSPQATIYEGNGSKTTPYVVGEKIANRTIS